MSSYTSSIPARFQAVHEYDQSLYLANECRGTYVYADEVVRPHQSLDPVYNLELILEDGTIKELRDALEEALSWLHRVEAQSAEAA